MNAAFYTQIENGARATFRSGHEPAAIVIHETQRDELAASASATVADTGRLEVYGLPVYLSQELYGPMVVSKGAFDVLRKERAVSTPTFRLGRAQRSDRVWTLGFKTYRMIF